jgi:hypothetical protein
MSSQEVNQKFMSSQKIFIYEVTWQCDVTDVSFKKVDVIIKFQMSASYFQIKRTYSIIVKYHLLLS